MFFDFIIEGSKLKVVPRMKESILADIKWEVLAKGHFNSLDVMCFVLLFSSC